MKNLPKITVITPSYNQGAYIEQTIQSVIAQNYPNLEYIIIDGGSTDNTVDIIKKYENYITYWVSEKDAGQSDAINKGLAKATGEVFNWLNSDDYYMPNALHYIGQQYLENSALNILCAKELQKSADGYEYLTKGTTIRPTVEETIAYGNNNQPPTFFKMDIVRALGGINPDIYFCMDSDLWIKYLLQSGLNGVKKTDFVVNVFRLHETSKTVSANDRYLKDRFNILLALGRSLHAVNFPIKDLEETDLSDTSFSSKYDLSPFIKQQLLAAYVGERIIHYFVHQLSWSAFRRLYVYSFLKKPLGRQWRFYASPLIRLKRIMLKQYGYKSKLSV
jgi:glycosyltransferase involved in cell wall biosynthesis